MNINILYESKSTKFGKAKYEGITNYNEIILNSQKLVNLNKTEKISNRWLIQKGNNCRYNSFIIFMYFAITPFINSLRDKNLILLNKLNELILNLAKNINDKNYCDIIIFLQKNKFDSNNAKLDKIIKEQGDEKKKNLLKS